MFDERTPPQKVDIPGYPYYITIDGEVFRNGAKEPLKPVLRRDGYSVTLSVHNKRKCFRINNLMREAYFNGTKLPLKHLDRDSKNFSYWNIKPMTRAEIAKMERPNGYNAKSVVETLPDGTENIYASAAECARKIFVSSSTVCNWCNKRRQNFSNDNTYRWEDE